MEVTFGHFSGGKFLLVTFREKKLLWSLFVSDPNKALGGYTGCEDSEGASELATPP